MSEKPFVSFLFAFMAGAIPVFGAAILFSLTVAGRELSRGPVELPRDAAQSSSHEKSAGRLRIDPDRALLATLLETTDLDPIASVPGQSETLAEPDPGYDSSSPTDEMNVGLTSAPAMSPASEGNAPEETATIHPEPKAATLEGSAIASAGVPPETVPQLLGTTQKNASRSSKKPNASAYGSEVYAALARNRPTAVERGSTTVIFAIGSSGALNNVRVGHPSGSTRLDQMALQMVRDAAPFTPPPDGASSYTIQIDFQ